MVSDIHTAEDLRRLVQTFYSEVLLDSILGPVFANQIPANAWPAHLDTMVSFWSAVLAEPGYRGRLEAGHVGLPVSESHFDRWLMLFSTVVNELFAGANADIIKSRAVRSVKTGPPAGKAAASIAGANVVSWDGSCGPRPILRLHLRH
jgi:hemoglobin